MEKYLGVVGLSLVLYFVFKNPQGTGRLVQSIADANVGGIKALQGRN